MSAETVEPARPHRSRDKSAFPPDVRELMPAARRLATKLGAVPSRNRLMTDLRIGAPKAKAVLAELQAATQANRRAVDPEQPTEQPEADELAGDTAGTAAAGPDVGTPPPAATGPQDTDPAPDAPAGGESERWGGSFLLTGRTGDERGRDQDVDTEIRQAWRDERRRAALAEAGRHRREAEAHDQIADQQTTDRVWQARSLSEVERHTGAAAYIVALTRARKSFTYLCLALLAGGTVWGSINAHATMMRTVHDPSSLVNTAMYGVDPLVTMLLIGLLWVRSAVSARGESLGSPTLTKIEAALLAATVVLNAGPFLPVIGHWTSALAAFGHMVPAGVVTLTVLAYPIVDRLTALKLRAARAELSD